MGRSGSSSKRKHSKKKSLKVSSEVRRKKRSRRTKSKKLRHHDDSFSSYSDDESTSSSLLSSSSSEDDYKSRKSRSRSRSDLKSTKKRTRKRSCSEDSTNDSHPVKKRKRSKKKTDSDKKKKNKKIKKKSRKDAYTSSSSDSASCSTCGDEDSSSDEDTHKGKTGKRKNKSRTTRSFSPNYYDDDNIENIPVENNPRRLKSVITIATQPENEEVDDMKRDEHKEEMVYDHDYDYPSCKSNDSNDDETKKELVEKEKNGGDNLDTGVDDLESILRQKALENLSRFRGALQTKPVVNVDDKQKIGQSSVDLGQSGVDLGQTSVSQPGIQRRSFTWRRDDSVKEKVENKIENETSTNNSEVEKSTVELENSTVELEKSKGQQSEGNENSQFEKKTMSVMRGGEMVQVSYKVYIPNRAPALARRQLKR